MTAIRERYEVSSGLSDHTGNIFAGLAAVALGADVLEVHVALSREMFGPDVPASVTTGELRQLVDGARQIEKMTAADVDKDQMSTDLEPLRKLFTKSVVAGDDLPAGTILTSAHLKLKKPGIGVPASQLSAFIGRTLRRNIRTDEFLAFHDVEP
jgi:N-acetylneuraminate synthase